MGASICFWFLIFSENINNRLLLLTVCVLYQIISNLRNEQKGKVIIQIAALNSQTKLFWFGYIYIEKWSNNTSGQTQTPENLFWGVTSNKEREQSWEESPLPNQEKPKTDVWSRD